MQKHTTDKFLIGSWVSFYSHEIHSFEYQLDQMWKAGLNFNIFPHSFGGSMHDPAIAEKVEAAYARRDMYYFMDGGLSVGGMEKGVETARGKAHCIGYHLVDEPGGAALPSVGKFCRDYRALDGERYPYVNLFPSYVGTAAMEGSYYEYATRFVKEAGAENIEYLSHDYYPFHQGGTALTIFSDMEVIRRVALENGGLRTHAFPQSTAWMGTRMPNADEMRWNVYAYLAYGFKALSWFNLVCPGRSDTEGECFRESVIYRDGEIHDPQLFTDFGNLNREVHTLGDTLMKLETLHAYHTKGGISGVELLPSDWMITPAAEDADFVISHMETAHGETYLMLFNKSWESPVTASFALSPESGIESLSHLSPFTGEYSPVSVADGLFTESFRPGEGKLYRLGGKPVYRPSAASSLSVKPIPAVIIPKGASAEVVTSLLPAAVVVVDANGVETYAVPAWSTENLDTDRSGEVELVGSVTLSDGTPAAAVARLTVTVTYDVDFTALREALSTVDGYSKADYTPESWKGVQGYYDAARAMLDGTYPQNAVTVAAWKLLDSLKELVRI